MWTGYPNRHLMARRIGKWIASIIGIVVVLLLLLVVVVRVFNPRPHARIGWHAASPMPGARGEMASAVLDNRLFTIGGLVGIGSVSDDVDIYDVLHDRWQVGPKLPVAVHHAAAATDGGRVWVSGGARSVRDWTPSDELYSIKEGVGWTRAAAMPEGRQGHAMVGIGRKLYVIGGVGETNRTLIYDTTTRRWTTGAPIPAGRNHLRAAVWDGRIWVLGGRNPGLTSRVDIYDPSTDAWSNGPALPQPMSAMSVGVVAGHLHVIDGEDPRLIGHGVIHAHYVLDFPTGRWRTVPDAKLGVHGAAYGTVGARFVVVGGASRNGALSVLSWTNYTQVLDTLKKAERHEVN